MNNCIFVGNVVRDCELTYVGETAKATFDLAINKKVKEQTKVTYIPCVLWANRAEGLCDYIKQGQQLMVQGELDINKKEYEDGWKTFVTLNVVQLEFGNSPREKKENPVNKYKNKKQTNAKEKTRKNYKRDIIEDNEDKPF